MSIKKNIGIGEYHEPVTKDYVNDMSNMIYEEPFHISDIGIWACENWRHIPTGLLLVHRTKGSGVPITVGISVSDEWFLLADGAIAAARVTSVGELQDYLSGRDQFFIKNGTVR